MKFITVRRNWMPMGRRVLFCAGGFGAKCTTLRAMAKTYRPYVPEQDLLLPPSLRDWLPEGHLAFFVSDLVGAVGPVGDPAGVRRRRAWLPAVPPGHFRTTR